MLEGDIQHLVVGLLHDIRKRAFLLLLLFLLLRLDKEHLQIRNHHDCQEERHHKVDGDGHREIFYRILECPPERVEQWEENDADAERGQHHRHEILLGRIDGCLLGLHTLIEVFQVAIDHHDGIVYHHTKHHDQGCQGDDVQLDAHHIHDAHRNKGTQRNGDGCHDGGAQWEQKHHHHDDDHHGDDQVSQERIHALSYYLRLIGYARQRHIFWEFRQTIIVQHLVHILAILHDIIAWNHLQGEQDA